MATIDLSTESFLQYCEVVYFDFFAPLDHIDKEDLFDLVCKDVLMKPKHIDLMLQAMDAI